MIVSKLRALGRDDRGVSLIEFAFTAPILVSLYLGGYQLCDTIAAKRKVTIATRAVADLTSQYSTLTNADLDTILNASQQIMAPYSVSNATLIVMQVTTDGSGASKVDWSRGKNVTPPAVNSTFNVPATIKQNNTSIIVAKVTYTYVPIAAANLIGNIPMQDTIIMSPRVSDSIPVTS